MWQQYKKTFAKTQTVIVVATFATYVWLGHELARSAVFLSMMELGAVAGAMWGARLKRKVDRETC
jgi:uncharacterized membrane protein YfcA